MSNQIKFILNDKIVEHSGNQKIVLLDYIRKEKQLTGSKEVCKEGDCGACAVIKGNMKNNVITYNLINSCLYPLGNIKASHIVTIEGLNVDEFTPIQQKFVDEGASQCGFCTPGFIVAFTSYFLASENYNVLDAIDSLGGNICRCTGYMSIKRSVESVIKFVNDEWNDDLTKIENLISLNILPEYFNQVNVLMNSISLHEEKITGVERNGIIISGGTDLFVQKADEVLDELATFGNDLLHNEIEETEDEIIIGGQVTFEQINQSKIIKNYFPEINDYMFLIASLPIRNSATIAGNLVNASPIGDMSIFLLSLDSRIVLESMNGRRELLLKDFYLGYKKLNKVNDEIVKEIKFNKPSGAFRFNFEKVSKRTNLDIASVNSAISMNIDGNKIISGTISFGGVAPVPLRLELTSALLQNAVISTELVDSLIDSANSEIAPISDIRGSAEYKRLLVAQMIKKHILKLFPAIIGEEVFT